MPAEIPAEIQHLLWDVAAQDWDIERQRDRIASRVMTRGTLAAMRWLLKTYDRDTLRDVVTRLGARQFAPRELVFWTKILDMPPIEQPRGGGRPTWTR